MKIVICLLVATFVSSAYAHGNLERPVPRINSDPKRNRFTSNRCSNNAPCGPCGDPLKYRRPRQHENGGKFGKGNITAIYKKGQIVDARVNLYINHGGGDFTFSICKLNSCFQLEEESCFIPMKVNGSDSFPAGKRPAKDPKTNKPSQIFDHLKVQLPKSLTCDRCVFRWRHVGNVEPREYINCADVQIK